MSARPCMCFVAQMINNKYHIFRPLMLRYHFELSRFGRGGFLTQALDQFGLNSRERRRNVSEEFCHIHDRDAINHALSTYHHFAAFFSPFTAILHGINQVFVTGNSKDTTVLELFGQGNNVKVQETNLTLIPASP